MMRKLKKLPKWPTTADIEDALLALYKDIPYIRTALDPNKMKSVRKAKNVLTRTGRLPRKTGIKP